MKNIPRILVCTFSGALLCAVLTALLFSLGAMVDGTPPGEAFFYGAFAGVAAALFGALIGLSVAVANLGWPAGGIAGLLATAGVVAFYVLAFSRPGQIGYFLSESRIILIVLALPAALTGILTALVNRRLLERR